MSKIIETVDWNSGYWRKIRCSVKPKSWEIDLNKYSDRDKETLGIYINRDGKAAVAVKWTFRDFTNPNTYYLDIYGYLKVYTSQAGVDLYYIPYEDGFKIVPISDLIQTYFINPDLKKIKERLNDPTYSNTPFKPPV